MTELTVRRIPSAARITVISPGPTAATPQSPAASRRPKVVMAVVGLTAAARLAGDRRTHERVILLAIALAAAVGLARAGEVRSIARLIDWDRRQAVAEQRRAKTPRP
jgi:hypothetical protein